MIDKTILEKDIGDLPSKLFHHGFDDPQLADQRFPGLVIASLDHVPKSASHWFLASQDCDGFSCDSLEAAILPLDIDPDYIKRLNLIVNEDFFTLK